MSALFGIYHLDGSAVDPHELACMNAALAHRGPDGAQCWQAGPVGMGQRLLCTTPESRHERLPYTEDAAGVTITADARLDNRDELLTALGWQNGDAVTLPDSRLILAAYQRWGTACVEHLVGEYAFAIWDAQAQRLFAARDVFGIRPFFYYHGNGAVYFASQIGGLVCLPAVPRAVNEQYLAFYLVEMLPEASQTSYAGILRLPPAHTLTVDRHGVCVQRYWTPNPTTELRLSSDAEYAEAFREQFLRAVHAQMRSAAPLASTLSGGMDSSSIACAAREAMVGQGSSLQTFSASFSSFPTCDEREYYQTVTRMPGIQAHTIEMDTISPFRAYLQTQPFVDEPFFGYTVYLHWAMYQAAQAQGVRVLLDGHGGDSVVAHGFLYLHELFRAGRWGTLLRETRAMVQRQPGYTVPQLLKDWVWSPLVPPGARTAWRRLHGRSDGAHLLARSPMAASFRTQLGFAPVLEQQLQAELQPHTVREDQCLELAGNPVYPLMFEAHQAVALGCNLDVRYPFFDRRLVEFCLSLPASQRIAEGWTRMIFRRAMEGILPPEIQWRAGKSNLSPYYYRTIYQRDQELLLEVLEENRERLAPYIDATFLDSCMPGAAQPNTRQHWRKIWLVATLGLFLHRVAMRSTPAREVVPGSTPMGIA